MLGLECLELAEETVVLRIRDLRRVEDVVGARSICSRRRATCSAADMH
jgi:hypothetical protein